MAGDSLVRANFFDGRFLTADAMRMEQSWVDTRARLLAQAAGPGVAFGLLPTTDLFNTGRPKGGGVELSAGLAFDGRGAPVLVSAAIHLQWTDLTLGEAPTTTVTPAGTRFSGSLPAAPKAPPAPEPVDPGLHLLWISAEELPESEARLIDPRSALGAGEVDAWRGGFRLSLRRVGAPSGEETLAWARRGRAATDALSWADAVFADESGLALALLEVDGAGGVIWVDPWVPLRAGARGRGARSSRQFQGMLADMKRAGTPLDVPLSELGFQSLPPFGALPFAVAADQPEVAVAGAVMALDGFNVEVVGLPCPDGGPAAQAAAQLAEAPSLPVGARVKRRVRLFLPTGGGSELIFAVDPEALPLSGWEVPAPVWPKRQEGPLTWDQVHLGPLEQALAAFAPVDVGVAPTLLLWDTADWTVGPGTDEQVRGWLLKGTLALLGARRLADLLPQSQVAQLLEEDEQELTLADLAGAPLWVGWIVGPARLEALRAAVRALGLSRVAWALISGIMAAAAVKAEGTALQLFLVGLRREVEEGMSDHAKATATFVGRIPEIVAISGWTGLPEVTLLGRIAEMVPFLTAAGGAVAARWQGDLTWESVPPDWTVKGGFFLLNVQSVVGLRDARGALQEYRNDPTPEKKGHATSWVRRYLVKGLLAVLGGRSMVQVCGPQWAGVGVKTSALLSGILVKDAFLSKDWLEANGIAGQYVQGKLKEVVGGRPSLDDAITWLVDQTVTGKLDWGEGQDSRGALLERVFGAAGADELRQRAQKLAVNLLVHVGG